MHEVKDAILTLLQIVSSHIEAKSLYRPKRSSKAFRLAFSSASEWA
jgi:hypothetical protein